MSERKFTVIIVGGSVTGLTLAHALHKIGVQCIILEKRADIAPQEGASIGILPNGARILDQLGVYDSIEQATAPLGATHIHFPDDFHFTSPYPKKMLENFGYPIAFLERRRLLEILHDTLPDKTIINVNREVSHIEQYSENGKSGVRVWALDGNVFEGDLVVGADGVRSRTRAEMWRLSGSSTSGEVPLHERNNVSAEYSCVFGISRGVSGLKAGEQIMRIYNGRTLVVIPSKHELVFWFLSNKLDQGYKNGEIPRFTKEDANALCLQLVDALVDNEIRFGDVWAKRQVYNMVTLEENIFQRWSFGRMVCIGDSMHKMTVNLGQGANCAIEDVAVLSNLLRGYLAEKKGAEPTEQELEALLCRFNHNHLPRVSRLYDMSWLIARVHARDGFTRKLIGRYVMPHFGERFESRPFGMIADAAALDFLPLPRAAFPGWNKYKTIEKKPRALFWLVISSLVVLILAAFLSGKQPTI
ncbi:FAD binding domain-containing protein [Paramyrothecium foliicola]|nr:FAD binding domain-containing protein [Paramyrothecium foliicola]